MTPVYQILLSIFQQHFGAIFGYSGTMLMLFVFLIFGGEHYSQFINYALSAWFASIMTYVAKAEGLPTPDTTITKPTEPEVAP